MSAPLEQGALGPESVTKMVLLPLDDPNRRLTDSGLPSAMIRAGGDAFHRLKRDRSLDADSCSIAVGIYRAMTEAHAKEIATLSAPTSGAKRMTAGEWTPLISAPEGWFVGRDDDTGEIREVRYCGGHDHTYRDRQDRVFSPDMRFTPTTATPPGVPTNHPDVLKFAGQLLDEIDGLIETTDGIAVLHRNGDLATWEELLPEGQYERLSSFDMLRDALAAANTARAISLTPPGVPDSVRALSEDETKRVVREGMAKLWDAEEAPSSAAMIRAGKWDDTDPVRSAIQGALFLREAIATHAAGQSAGSGAVAQALRQADWGGVSIGNKALIAAAINELEKLAPDSTRTGPVGTVSVPVNPTDEMLYAGRWLMDCGSDAAASVYEAMIAARPAAPEAQGAERRPIDTAPKDRSEILLFGTLARSRAKPSWFIGAWFPTGEHGEGWWVSSCVEVIATEWAPLPAPPSPGQGGR